MKHMYTLIANKPESSGRCGDEFGADFVLVCSHEPQEIASAWAKACETKLDDFEKGYEITILVDGHKMANYENGGVTCVDKEEVYYLEESEQPAFLERLKAFNALEQICSLAVAKIREEKLVKAEQAKKAAADAAEKKNQDRIYAEKAEYERLKNIYGPGANNV